MRRFILVIIAALSVSCANGPDSHYGDMGRFEISGFEWETGYGHNFGDSSGGSLTGNLSPEHGKFDGSRFRLDQADQFSEDRIDTRIRVIWSIK